MFRSEGSNFLSVFRFNLGAALFLMLCVWAAVTPTLAANYEPPSLTAWQRSHEGHLTIEWSKTTGVQQKREGNRLVLRFAAPIAVDAASTLRNLSNFVDPDRSVVEGTDLSLALKSGVFSKVKVENKRIVTVHFFRDPASASLSTIRATAIDNGLRLTLDWPGPTRIETSKGINELRLDVFPAWNVDPAELTDLQRSLRPWFNRVRSDRDRKSTRLAFVLQPQIVSSVRPEGMTRTVIDLIRDASALPTPAAGPASRFFIPKERPSAATIAAAVTSRAEPPIPRKRPSLAPEDAGITVVDDETAAGIDNDGDRPEALVIDWNEPVAAAVFIRAGHLWTVFDETDASLLSGLPRSPAAFGRGSLVPADGGTALRFPLNGTANVVVSREGEGRWLIEPISTPSAPRSLNIERVADPAKLRVAPVSGQHIVSIIDPLVGDRIDVLPLGDPGFGQQVRQRYVDLELLPTAQGLAWRPLNDQLIAEVANKSLKFSSTEGLSLSATTADAPVPETPVIIDAMSSRQANDDAVSEELAERPAVMLAKAAPDPKSDDAIRPSSYFDLAGSGVDRQLVGEFRRIRRQAIGRAAPEERDRARIDLARLLVSERLATEARTVLSAISDKADDDIALQKRALRGVAAFLIGHLTEASALLLDPDLNDDDEIDIWRAALDSGEDRWQAAAERWRAASDTLDLYPLRLQLDLGLMAVEAAIETNDDKMTRKGIRRLTSLPLGAYDQAKVDAMQALKAERAGDLDKARILLTKLAESPHPAVSTLADFRLVALNFEESDNRSDKLASFSRRMPLWRGHPQERSMLDELARRFRSANALQKALNIWRRLIRLYPEAAHDDEIRKARQDTFVQALANATEPAIDLLDVYAIYLDFINLLPDDPEARRVHRDLARLLIDLDLLDEAIEVLRSLMTTTTDDLGRAELGSEIALLMLLQNQAAPALSILDRTGGADAVFPASLVERRRLAKARALSQLGRVDDALLEIRDMRSNPARRLQAEILWREQRWPRLAAVIDSYFANIDPSPRLTDEDQELVLWLALARQETGKADQLHALRQRFGDAMQSSVHAQAFDVATQAFTQTDDIKTLLATTESQLAEIQRLRDATRTSP